jgi:uncharacterized protein (TIGR02117 family)
MGCISLAIWAKALAKDKSIVLQQVFFVGLISLVSAGCTSTPVKPYNGTAPKVETIYLISSGWHTEVALPVKSITGRLTIFRKTFPSARFLAFGWGERAFFMNSHPTIIEALRALFPAPSVLLVLGLVESPRRAFAASVRVLAVRVSRPGLAHLSRYIWSYVAKQHNYESERLAAGPLANSAFYDSTGIYHAFHTCNTWTAEALHVAGVPVNANGVIFAGQVIDQVSKAKAVQNSRQTYQMSHQMAQRNSNKNESSHRSRSN